MFHLCPQMEKQSEQLEFLSSPALHTVKKHLGYCQMCLKCASGLVLNLLMGK